jgi:[acyl-carrier-protein] S-malonyltransferase
LYAIEAILVDALKAAGQMPDLVAGHSLGEYVALYAAGAFSFEAGLKLVKRRAELMQAASGGKMAAMIGFNRVALTEAIAATEGVVLANDNSDAQVVISGTPDAVDAILANVKAKRAVALAVSGAFHSPYMAEASAEFNEILAATEFADTAIGVLSNTDPTPETSGAALKERLSKQMTGSVRWRETMVMLNQVACTEAIEVGPGKVLTGLLKRACPNTALVNIAALADIA